MQSIPSTRKFFVLLFGSHQHFPYHNNIWFVCLDLGAFLNEKISCLLCFCLTNDSALQLSSRTFLMVRWTCILKAGISLANGCLNWRHLNSISWKTQWNKLKTLDEGIPFNDLCTVNMLQSAFYWLSCFCLDFPAHWSAPWADGMCTGCVGLCKSVLRFPAGVDPAMQVLHGWAV